MVLFRDNETNISYQERIKGDHYPLLVIFNIIKLKSNLVGSEPVVHFISAVELADLNSGPQRVD